MQRAVVVTSVLVLMMVAGCSKDQTPVSVAGADQLARQILDQIAAGDGLTVYDAHFSPELRQLMSQDEWAKTVDCVVPFGAVQSANALKTDAISVEEGVSDASLLYAVQWEKKTGQAQMTMIRREGGDWKVMIIEILPDVDIEGQSLVPAVPVDAAAPVLPAE